MAFTDRFLKCVYCGREFVFTVDEQIFFQEKQFQHEPKHCKPCRARRAGGQARVPRETAVICAACGTPTTVPFKPTQSRPVLCRTCFDSQVRLPLDPAITGDIDLRNASRQDVHPRNLP
jgi:CxxC-x17-CxxC domain-containing protein